VDEAQYNAFAERDTLVQQIYTEYYGYKSAVDTIESNKAKTASADFQVQLDEESYKKGLLGLDVLLNDQATALNDRINVIESRYAAWDTYADLVQALGRPFTLNLPTPAP
jgi:outer membrane protein TolC